MHLIEIFCTDANKFLLIPSLTNYAKLCETHTRRSNLSVGGETGKKSKRASNIGLDLSTLLFIEVHHAAVLAGRINMRQHLGRDEFVSRRSAIRANR